MALPVRLRKLLHCNVNSTGKRAHKVLWVLQQRAYSPDEYHPRGNLFSAVFHLEFYENEVLQSEIKILWILWRKGNLGVPGMEE